MKPKESAGCHQTLSSLGGGWARDCVSPCLRYAGPHSQAFHHFQFSDEILEAVKAEAVECACMGRGRVCIYGRGGVCMHEEREGVYIEGVECVCMGRGGCVY